MDNFNLKQYLTEGRLFKEVEGSNPVFDEYMKIRNSIDYKTVFPSDLDDFVKDLDNTDRENLQKDLENYSNDDVKLTPEEQKIFDDITSSLNEGKFEDVVSKVKEYTRKGLMTAAILSALMSPQLGFSKSQHQELQNIAKTEISPMSNLKKGDTVKYKLGSTDIMSMKLDGDVFKIDLKDSGDSNLNQKIIDSLLDLGGSPNKEINWEEDNSISVPITNAKDLSNTLDNIFKLYKNG